jgi:hypothetical protein
MIYAFISLAVLLFILRYRVHIHVSYTPRVSSLIRPGHGEQRVPRPEAARHPRPADRRNAAGAPSRKSEASRTPGKVEDASPKSDLESALVGLGTSRSIAKRAAERAMAHGDSSFETSLRRAIDYARLAA